LINSEIYINTTRHIIKSSLGETFGYRKICICSGSVPKVVDFDSPFIIGLRDTDSAADLKLKLSKSKRVCVLGNGGIATELIYELKNIDVIWVIRDKYIASAFVDSGAAEFLMHCADGTDKNPTPNQHAKMLRYTTAHVFSDVEKGIPGCALGPNWHASLELTGALEKKNVTIEYQTFIKDVSVTKPATFQGTEEWPAYVTLNNGKVFGCDFIVSATGVSPSIPDIEVNCNLRLFPLQQVWLMFLFLGR
jgi:NAD(P)H-nitrite reductase large subunit